MVYLLGAGIGSYKYISVEGLEIIKNCDVLIYDKLIDDTLLSFVKKDCKLIYAGKSPDNHSMKQSAINELIISMAKKYNTVVRLKGGDPFVFGRGAEEAEKLIENNIPFKIIPGITSAIAVPELCGIPVTYRGLAQDFHIVTGHTAEDNNINYKALAEMNGTIVFLMGIGNIGTISSMLIKYGKDKNTPTAVIENGGTVNQRIFHTSLCKVKDCVSYNNISSPSVIVIGNTGNMNLKCNLPTVGIIGTPDFKSRLAKRLYNYNVIDIGTLNIKRLDFDFTLDYDCIVLTSRNGARIFMDYIKENNIDIRKLADIKFAVIGKGTYTALKEYGIYADIMPEEYTCEKLSEILGSYEGRMLILRAKKGSESLYKYINNYTDIRIYDIEAINLKKAKTDYVIFGSSSAVEYYCNKYKIDSCIIAIGNTTANRLKDFGYNPYVADECSIDSIVNKIEVLEYEKNEKTKNN